MVAEIAPGGFIHEVVEELGLGAIRKKYIERKAGRTGTHRDASSFSGFNASKTVSVNKEELLTSSNIHEMDRLGDDARSWVLFSNRSGPF
jgi:hypothetical protein